MWISHTLLPQAGRPRSPAGTGRQVTVSVSSAGYLQPFPVHLIGPPATAAGSLQTSLFRSLHEKGGLSASSVSPYAFHLHFIAFLPSHFHPCRWAHFHLALRDICVKSLLVVWGLQIHWEAIIPILLGQSQA